MVVSDRSAVVICADSGIGSFWAECMAARMIAYSQDARIDIDDVRDATDLALAFKDFVDLLLIPGDYETRAALAEDIGHLFGHAVLIDRHRDGADHLAGVGNYKAN